MDLCLLKPGFLLVSPSYCGYLGVSERDPQGKGEGIKTSRKDLGMEPMEGQLAVASMRALHVVGSAPVQLQEQSWGVISSRQCLRGMIVGIVAFLTVVCLWISQGKSRGLLTF